MFYDLLLYPVLNKKTQKDWTIFFIISTNFNKMTYTLRKWIVSLIIVVKVLLVIMKSHDLKA